MKKNILLVEDNGSLTRDFTETLKNLDREIKCAYSYSSAIGFWDKYNGIFDCIILDLNISPDGLSPEETNRYFPICGIAFLDYIIQSKSLKERDAILSKTIIYSGFIDELKKRKQDFSYYDHLKLIAKTGLSFSKVIRNVEQIIK